MRYSPPATGADVHYSEGVNLTGKRITKITDLPILVWIINMAVIPRLELAIVRLEFAPA